MSDKEKLAEAADSGLLQPRLVRESSERRLAAIASENKSKMEKARRNPSGLLNVCTCGRSAILVASINLGRFEVHCESYWDAEGWSCPEGRCTDDHTEARDAEAQWNSGNATIFGIANAEPSYRDGEKE